MADEEGLQALAPQGAHDHPAPQDPPPPQNPQNPLPPQNPQIPIVPNAPPALVAPHIPPLNWSHFKTKYSGKPDEDAEAHLLRTNNWMDTHGFQDHVKVQRFCLTLTGEARLWYESLRPINADWVGLQNTFRQQYSKIGNTREQLFHVWRPFHFDENVEMIDTYINCIRQVNTLLGYQEPQILEVFKNTLLTKLYWVLFPIMDLSSRDGKENFNKRKDRQTIGRTDFFNSVHEHKRWFWQKSYI